MLEGFLVEGGGEKGASSTKSFPFNSGDSGVFKETIDKISNIFIKGFAKFPMRRKIQHLIPERKTTISFTLSLR